MEAFFKTRLTQLREIKEACAQGGGVEKIEQRHSKGKWTARERIRYLLDEQSFVEFSSMVHHLDQAPTDGIVSGYGTINGRIVCVYAQDATVRGGSVGSIHGYKMYKTIERALDMGVPLVGLHDSPGQRLPRLTEGQSAYGDLMEKSGGSVFYPNTQASGVVPQISAILGSCAGISVYSPALNDFIFMVDHLSHMYITGPAMTKTVIGEDIDHERLGGSRVHCAISGVADARFPSEQECLDRIKELLAYLPNNAEQAAPHAETGDDPDRTHDEILDVVPASPHQPYDMKKVISCLVDDRCFFEIKKEFAGEIIVGFARLNGQTVGLVANQPMVRAGCLTVDSSDKQSRFIRFCDCFNIPLVLLVDTPAYLPGSDQEYKGIIRHGAKVLYALCEATVPKIVVVIRKCYGGGNLGMGVLPGLGTDMVFYWPVAEAGVLGAKASVELYFGKEIKVAIDPDALRREKTEEYYKKYSNPIQEASVNWSIEDVIDPGRTRIHLIQALRLLRTKKRIVKYRKKHGNMPL